MIYYIPQGTPIIVYGLYTVDYSSCVVTTTEHECAIYDNERTCIIDKWHDLKFGFINNEDTYLRFPSDMTNEGKMFWLILSYKDVVRTK